MNNIDRRTLPKKESVIQQISETKQKNGRREILNKIIDNNQTQINNNLAICSHRKLKHISFEDYKNRIKNGETINDIIKTTSKHLIYFYNALLKNKVNLDKKEFQKMYDEGMSLDQISEAKHINREHMTYLREFYGIKRKGATYQNRLSNEKPLSQEAKDIIVGSMLGDGHLTKWGYFSEKHSPKQLEYLQWKASFFPHITTKTSWSYYEEIDKRSGSVIKSHNFRTRTHSWLQEMEKLWYKNIDKKRTKVVPNEITDWMNETVLAVWFMDDGKTDWCYRNGKKEWENAKPTSQICTDSFSENDLHKLIIILKLKFSLDTTINKRNRLFFNTENAAKLLKIIKPLIHNNLLHKVSEDIYSELMLKI